MLADDDKEGGLALFKWSVHLALVAGCRTLDDVGVRQLLIPLLLAAAATAKDRGDGCDVGLRHAFRYSVNLPILVFNRFVDLVISRSFCTAVFSLIDGEEVDDVDDGDVFEVSVDVKEALSRAKLDRLFALSRNFS